MPTIQTLLSSAPWEIAFEFQCNKTYFTGLACCFGQQHWIATSSSTLRNGLRRIDVSD